MIPTSRTFSPKIRIAHRPDLLKPFPLNPVNNIVCLFDGSSLVWYKPKLIAAMAGLFEILQNSPLRGEILSVGAALTWAIAVLFFRVSGRTVHPLGLNLFQSFLSVVLLVLTMLVLGEAILPKTAFKDYALLGLSGFVGITLSDTFFFQCLNLLGASLTA